MTILWTIPGLILPTLTGWMLVRLLEWKTPVLFRIERWALGFLLGLTLTMFITFLAHVWIGLKLDWVGYLLIQIGLVIVIGATYFVGLRTPDFSPRNIETLRPTSSVRRPNWPTTLAAILIIWTLIKILTASITFLMLTPPYLDDTIDNWNFGGKVIFVEVYKIFVKKC